MIASRNGKGAVALKNRKATVFQMRSVSWASPFGHETDMHPVDLIRDSSMTGYAEILTGEPDAKINLQGSSE